MTIDKDPEKFSFRRDKKNPDAWLVQGPAGADNTAVEVQLKSGDTKSVTLGRALTTYDDGNTIYAIVESAKPAPKPAAKPAAKRQTGVREDW